MGCNYISIAAHVFETLYKFYHCSPCLLATALQPMVTPTCYQYQKIFACGALQKKVKKYFFFSVPSGNPDLGLS